MRVCCLLSKGEVSLATHFATQISVKIHHGEEDFFESKVTFLVRSSKASNVQRGLRLFQEGTGCLGGCSHAGGVTFFFGTILRMGISLRHWGCCLTDGEGSFLGGRSCSSITSVPVL